MLNSNRESKNLVFSDFNASEAENAKQLFDRNSAVVDSDPTFRTRPFSEYQQIIERINTGGIAGKQKTFYLEKYLNEMALILGTFSWNVNTPNAGVLWHTDALYFTRTPTTRFWDRSCSQRYC